MTTILLITYILSVILFYLFILIKFIKNFKYNDYDHYNINNKLFIGVLIYTFLTKINLFIWNKYSHINNIYLFVTNIILIFIILSNLLLFIILKIINSKKIKNIQDNTNIDNLTPKQILYRLIMITILINSLLSIILYADYNVLKKRINTYLNNSLYNKVGDYEYNIKKIVLTSSLGFFGTDNTPYYEIYIDIKNQNKMINLKLDCDFNENIKKDYYIDDYQMINMNYNQYMHYLH